MTTPWWAKEKRSLCMGRYNWILVKHQLDVFKPHTLSCQTLLNHSSYWDANRVVYFWSTSYTNHHVKNSLLQGAGVQSRFHIHIAAAQRISTGWISYIMWCTNKTIHISADTTTCLLILTSPPPCYPPPCYPVTLSSDYVSTAVLLNLEVWCCCCWRRQKN